MAVNKNDKAIVKGMLERIPSEWSSMMPHNMLTYFSAQMVGQRGYAKTVEYLLDMADVIEKCGMDLDRRNRWK
jgi:hypothetical protein